MLSNLPLRSRLSLLLGAVLAVGLYSGVTMLTLHAGARIRARAEAATRLGQDFVESALAHARGFPERRRGVGATDRASGKISPSAHLPRRCRARRQTRRPAQIMPQLGLRLWLLREPEFTPVSH